MQYLIWKSGRDHLHKANLKSLVGKSKFIEYLFKSQCHNNIDNYSGKGLGKNNEGNVKHINVTVKNDKKGVGVNQGEWEFAWWDHLYNKSADAVVVAKEEGGDIKIATKKKGETRRSKTGIISTQKPTGKSVKQQESSMTAVADAQNMMDSVKEVHINMAQRLASASLYGSFVKSASTSAAPTPGASDKEEEEEELKDYSMKVSDAELFAACEGRTARKGGRGLVDQTGKFKRVMKEYVRPKDDDDTPAQKRKRTDDSDEKQSKKAKKEAKKAAKLARKEAKKAKKEAKLAKKEAKKAKEEAKLAKKASKEKKKEKKKD